MYIEIKYIPVLILGYAGISWLYTKSESTEVEEKIFKKAGNELRGKIKSLEQTKELMKEDIEHAKKARASIDRVKDKIDKLCQNVISANEKNIIVIQSEIDSTKKILHEMKF